MEVAKLQIWNLLVHKKDYEIEDHEKQTLHFTKPTRGSLHILGGAIFVKLDGFQPKVIDDKRSGTSILYIA